MIIKLTLTVFITQLIFVAARTWNVRSIAKKDISMVMLSGAVVHISWLTSIAIGAASMHDVIVNFDLKYLPVVMASIVGTLLGSYISMK